LNFAKNTNINLDSERLFGFDSNGSFKYSLSKAYLTKGFNNRMSKNLSKNEIISIIKAEKSFLKDNFGVINIGLFGSYAKNQQTPDSDIDLLVEFAEPRFEWVAGLNIYMEKKFGRKIEIIRRRALNKSRFFERIEREIIYA
jgi:hypothetical protein